MFLFYLFLLQHNCCTVFSLIVSINLTLLGVVKWRARDPFPVSLSLLKDTIVMYSLRSYMWRQNSKQFDAVKWKAQCPFPLVRHCLSWYKDTNQYSKRRKIGDFWFRNIINVLFHIRFESSFNLIEITNIIFAANLISTPVVENRNRNLN